MRDSKIEWTTHTFNPWIGCTKVSPGCANCYAESLDERRFSKIPVMGASKHWGPGAPRHLTSEATWRQPRAWNAAAAKRGVRERVFCASLADVFDAEAPPGALDRLWELIRQTPSLDWLLLTKRPERIRESLPKDWGGGYANVWLGTSVEDQKRANERVPALLDVPARVRFLSCEPLLGAVVLDQIEYQAPGTDTLEADVGRPRYLDALLGYIDNGDERRIHWVIAGGESGPDARPMKTTWARDLRDQCAEKGVAFFFKQWGEWLPVSQDHVDPMDREERAVTDLRLDDASQTDADTWHKVGKKIAGRELDDRTHDDLPRLRAAVVA